MSSRTMNTPSRPIGRVQDTCWSPEDDETSNYAERHERAMERADRLRDEIRDRQAEQRDQEREDQP